MFQVTPIVLFTLSIFVTNVMGSEFDIIDSNDDPADEDELKRSRGINSNDPVGYLLYDHSDDRWVRMPRNDSVPTDLWIFGADIKILFHGFNGKIFQDPMKAMESMFIVGREYAKKNATLNIIAVDWTSLATRPIIQYAEAAKNTYAAGIAVGKYLVNLRANKAFKFWRKLHLIGFSLGAHVAGIAGMQIQKLTVKHRKVGRITGLDPAGPEFDPRDRQMPSDTSLVLDKSDAQYVDIIHCNMGAPTSNLVIAVLQGKFGTTVQSGHADFYPNGGERQTFQCDEIEDRTGCSHNMCALFFALSITTELPACPCKNWSMFTAGLCSCWTGDKGKAEYMGDLSNRRGTARGKYFLVVDNKINVNYFTS